MSSSFDFLTRFFQDHFEHQDWYVKSLFKRALDEIHSANHDLQDKINRHPGLRSVIAEMQAYEDKVKEHPENDKDSVS